MRPLALALLTLALWPASVGLAETGGVAYPGDAAAEEAAEKDEPVKAKITKRGRATVTDSAPEEIKRLIKAGNRLIGKPYRYGGGHARFQDSGYDCSGTVSYALRGGRLIDSPLPSGALMSWGKRGRGQFLTVYANSGHTFLEVAGIRLDTSAAGDPSGKPGPRWRPALKEKRGYKARHWPGL